MSVADRTSATGPAVRLCELDLEALARVSWDATLQEVAQEVSARRCTAVIVGSGAAIVTEHDVVQAVATGRPLDSRARSFASTGVVTIPDRASVLDALVMMMRHGIRHLVVVDEDGDPRGMVSMLVVAAAVLSHADVPTWLAGLGHALELAGDHAPGWTDRGI